MIKVWALKAIVQKTISFFPNREQLNRLFQRYVTKGVYLSDEYFGFKIEHARDHLRFFKEYKGGNFENKTVLELGTGWYPIIPLAFYLNGFDKIISIDISQLMTKESLLDAIRKMSAWKQEGKLAVFLPDMDPERWATLEKMLAQAGDFDLNEMQSMINLETMTLDARNTPFEAGSMDFICSNNTFEHIYKPILHDILKEFKRILKKDGIMSHFIDMSDHFAHFDKSITVYNFLRFSERGWDWIDNRIQPQNRMRFYEYKNMYEELGIKILQEEIRPGDLEALRSIKLHPSFKSVPENELAITHGYLVS
ncbi:MAG: class I SAM-dependent methyltransferase [Saprospiraceae bacterium]